MKKVILREVKEVKEGKPEPFPAWELNYGEQIENLGNEVCKAIDRIDKIYEETGCNVEICLEFQPQKSEQNLKDLKRTLFGDRPYFDKIR